MDQMSVDYKLSVGQRIALKTKKSGTLRYIGLVSFSLGIWYGIELDEDDGDHDGSVDNVRYFSCKENHGLFCRLSDILKEPSLSIVDFDVLSECSTFQDSELFTDPNTTITKSIKNEALSLVESSDDPKEDLDDSLGIIDLDVVMAKSAEEGDTCLEDMRVYYPFTDDSREDFYNSGNATHSPAEQENLNVTQIISSPEESNLNRTQVIDSSEKQCNLNVSQIIHLPDEQYNLNTTLILNRTTEIGKKVSFDEEFSSKPMLHFLPTQMFNLDDKLHPTVDFCKPVDENHSKILGSRILIPFISTLPDSKSGESPLHERESSPKYASTPKHEANYTYNLDEDDLNSEQKFSPISHLDKTNVKYDAVKRKTVLLENMEPDRDNILPSETYIQLSPDTNGKNILNITCNTEKFVDYHHEFNKTTVFSHSLEPDHDNILPSETYVQLSSDTNAKNTLNATCNTEKLLDYHHEFNETTVFSHSLEPDHDNILPSETYIKLSSDTDRENTFNATCNIEKLVDYPHEFNKTTVFPCCVEPDHDNILHSKMCNELSYDTDEKSILNVVCSAEELGHEKLLYELDKTFNNFTLNTTIPICNGSNKSVDKSENELDKTQILNTTYEKKDEFAELPLTKKMTKVNKHEVKETSNTRKSKIAKHIDHSPSSVFASNAKYSEFDKTKVRKSMSLQSGSGNREIPGKNRRKTFGSKSSLGDDIVLGQCQKLSPNFDQKQNSTGCGTILKTTASFVRSPRKISCGKSKSTFMKGETDVESKKTKHKSVKSASKISTLIPKPSSRLTEESKSTLQEKEKFDETINLTKPVSYIERRVFEKSKLLPKRFSVTKSENSKISSAPSSLMCRPFSSKIEESIVQEEQSTVQKEQKMVLGEFYTKLNQSVVPSEKVSIEKCGSEITSSSSSLVTKSCSNKIEKSKSIVQNREIFSHESKKLIQSELATEGTFKKPERPPKRFSEVKYEVPRSIFTGKSSLPVPKKETAVKSTIKTTNETIHLSGLKDKRVLSQMNRHDIGSGSVPSYVFPAPSKAIKKQSLGSMTSPSDDAASQSLAAVQLLPIVQSHIPLSSNRRKRDDEKSKPISKTEKSKKKNTLR